MPKRIPIAAAERFAKEQGLQQVVILAYDGDLIHAVSYGSTKKDCTQAAKSAKWAMEALCSPTPIRELATEDRLGAK